MVQRATVVSFLAWLLASLRVPLVYILGMRPDHPRLGLASLPGYGAEIVLPIFDSKLAGPAIVNTDSKSAGLAQDLLQ